MSEIRISLLHLALKPGAVAANIALVEQGVRAAAASGADWAIAPELCISGYQFVDVIGTNWTADHPDQWTRHICELAEALQLAIWFGHAERDRSGNSIIPPSSPIPQEPS